MLESKGNYIFDKVEEKISKAGNPYKLVHIIDKDNFERLEFFGDDDLKVTANPGTPCRFQLKAKRQGYSTAVNCINVMGA
ncbi:hypothetical protein [Enterococcus dispar]|jgi:hypothetical protein|uniref:hypothetical protein n=1 Tax=Enterococcus dispar TaxID=44009 RepID=UPI00189D2B81|nr:hypothetical protein [Enterococcus dispar]